MYIDLMVLPKPLGVYSYKQTGLVEYRKMNLEG